MNKKNRYIYIKISDICHSENMIYNKEFHARNRKKILESINNRIDIDIIKFQINKK